MLKNILVCNFEKIKLKLRQLFKKGVYEISQ